MHQLAKLRVDGQEKAELKGIIEWFKENRKHVYPDILKKVSSLAGHGDDPQWAFSAIASSFVNCTRSDLVNLRKAKQDEVRTMTNRDRKRERKEKKNPQMIVALEQAGIDTVTLIVPESEIIPTTNGNKPERKKPGRKPVPDIITKEHHPEEWNFFTNTFKDLAKSDIAKGNKRASALLGWGSEQGYYNAMQSGRVMKKYYLKLVNEMNRLTDPVKHDVKQEEKVVEVTDTQATEAASQVQSPIIPEVKKPESVVVDAVDPILEGAATLSSFHSGLKNLRPLLEKLEGSAVYKTFAAEAKTNLDEMINKFTK